MTAVPRAHLPGAVRRPLTAPGTSLSRRSAQLALLTVAMAAAFALGQAAVRHGEAVAVAAAVRLLGFHGVLAIQGSQLLISPRSGPLFWVDITASCSSLGPALAIALIAVLMSAGRPASDRWLAGMAGVSGIIAGNLVRIGSSVIVGLLAGRVSLVLFHDWVGSIFGFAYTIGGFVLALSILLRRGRRREGP